MENYEYIGDLGSGSYGFVWKCLQRSSGRIVAVKGFKLAHKDKKFLDQAIREVRMLRAAGDHPNVVQLLEAFRSNSGRVYMVFEFVEKCLSAELHKRFTCGLPAAQTRLVLWQLLAAVAHLHSKKILHRDIKPGNLLLTAEGVVKLCDFGFARTTRVDPYKADRFSSYVVTRWYRSPEMLVSDLYCAASDIWSLGCTFAELATGRALFPGNSSLDQLWRIMRCLGPLPPSQAERFAAAATAAGLPEAPPPPPRGKSLWQRLPELDPRLLDVVQACLRLDPVQRPTAAQLLQMPYFWDVPKAIAGTPLGQLYDEYGGAATLAHGPGRGPWPPPTASLQQLASPGPAPPGFASAPMRSVAASVLSPGVLSPRARRDAAAAASECAGGGGGAVGHLSPRPPSVLLSAVAASLLGEHPLPPGGVSGAVPLVSPRHPHEPLLGPDSGVGEGSAGSAESVGAPRSPAPAPPGACGAVPAAGDGAWAGGAARGGGEQRLAQAQSRAQQHKREELEGGDEDQQALHKRRATASAVAAAGPTAAAAAVAAAAVRGKAPDGRAPSVGGGVGPPGGAYGGKAARGPASEDGERALLSSDSILATAVGSNAGGGGARGGGRAAAATEEAPGAAPRRPVAVVDDSCYTAHASGGPALGGPGHEVTGRSSRHSARADGDGRGSGAREVPGGAGAGIEGPAHNGALPAQDSDVAAAAAAATAAGAAAAAGDGCGSVERCHSGRAARAESGGHQSRAGLAPGIGLLDDDELVSSEDGHVSDDDELMEYFAAKPRNAPSARAAGAAGSTDRLPKSASLLGHGGASPSRSAGAAAAGGAASDHGAAAAAARRGPTEGMHAGVQALHHGLYGSGSRQRSTAAGSATATGAAGRLGNRRVAALVLGTMSFGRHGVAASAQAPSPQALPPLPAKCATVGNFLASHEDISDQLPVLTSPGAPPAASTAASSQRGSGMLQSGTPAAALPSAPPRASTTLGTTTAAASVEAAAEALGPLSHADIGGIPPMGSLPLNHSTTVGFNLAPPLTSRGSMPVPGYSVTSSGLPPGNLMSAGHRRRAISRQGSTVFNQLMYDALPEIGTPGGAPEAPVGTPPRRRAVMSGFTPCRAAAARAAATGVPPAVAMAAAMGESMRSTVELSVAFSPIHVGRDGHDGIMSPDGGGARHEGGAEGDLPSQLRTCPSTSGVATAAAAAAAAARRYAQQSQRRHMSMMLPQGDRDRAVYATIGSGAAGNTVTSATEYPAVAAAAAAVGDAAAHRSSAYPVGSYQRPHGFSAASDTGMLLGGSAPNTAFFRPSQPARPPTAAEPSGGGPAAAVPHSSEATVAMPIPGGPGARLSTAVGIANPCPGGSGATSGGPGSTATPSPRGFVYHLPLTPATRSRLASGNMVRVSETPGNSAPHQRYQMGADDTQSSQDLDALPWGNLGMSPASGSAPPPPPPPHQAHAAAAAQQPQPPPQPPQGMYGPAPYAPPPSARARVGRWGSGIIDSLPEDREVLHVTADWRNSAGVPAQPAGAPDGSEGPIQAFSVYSSEWPGPAGPDGPAAAAGPELRPVFSTDNGGVAAAAAGAHVASPRSASAYFPHAGEGRWGPRSGSEGPRHGPVGPHQLLGRISPRLTRSGRSRPTADSGSAAAAPSPASPSPEGPRSGAAVTATAGGVSGASSGRWLPPVVAPDGPVAAAPLPQKGMDAQAFAMAGAGASVVNGAAGKRPGQKGGSGSGGEAGNGRNSSSKWPRAKALLGGRFLSSLVRRFKDQSSDK